MNTDNIIILNDSNFDSYVLNESSFILIDFWASWCNPCKLLSPILDDISKEFKHNLIIGKVDVEKNPNTGVKYSIQSVPTLLLLKNNKIIDKKIGMLSKYELKNFLLMYINNQSCS
ncbi:Thioredoxin 1 [Buchnera aphidicola (Eriosoma grossulariae)]|uniref:thioredoxin n=1 Tax=Buchnera aphidicola TaxID=9 RepID=UPI003463D519